MPSPLQWRRARAIHSLFKDIENVDSSVHQLVFAFCDCPPQVFSTDRAFALLTDWGAVVTWGDADFGGDSRGVAAQLSGGADCWRVLPDLTDGTNVLLVGLQRAELNGRRAVVRQPVVRSKPGRVGVEVDGKIVAIKRENLESS